MEPEIITKKIYKKGWGNEEWIVNNDLYCCKFLNFEKDKKFSMHYHLIKDETWMVLKGKFLFKWIDTKTAEIKEEILNKEEIIRIKPNLIHQLIALEESTILEISTQHFENDNYRVLPGDSQKN